MDDWEFNSQQDQVIFLFSEVSLVLTHLLSSGYQRFIPMAYAGILFGGGGFNKFS